MKIEYGYENINPHIGDEVPFTTEKDGLIVIGKGKVKNVCMVIENEKYIKKSHSLFDIETETGEIYRIHDVDEKNKKDSVILLKKEGESQLIYPRAYSMKRHYMIIENFYKQEAEKNLPKIGEQVIFTLNDNGNIIKGNGIVVHRIIRNPKKMEALFRIKNDNGEEIEVYHNSQRAINESVMLVSN